MTLVDLVGGRESAKLYCRIIFVLWGLRLDIKVKE